MSRRQRGAALLLVMWLILLLSGLVAGYAAAARIESMQGNGLARGKSSSEAARAGVDLQLSGHTHGGQFWPWNHFVQFQQPYTAGLHRHAELWVYTSRGTGYWGPPKRFGAPSEITRIRLVPARGERV